jgi:hypothetical protein
MEDDVLVDVNCDANNHDEGEYNNDDDDSSDLDRNHLIVFLSRRANIVFDHIGFMRTITN